MVKVFRYQQHPYIVYTKTPYIGGRTPTGTYRTNNCGFAGSVDTFFKKHEEIERVICIGGSTTEMAYEHFYNTYPYWLEQYLNNKNGYGYEVINAGCAGYTTVEMLINFELRLLNFKPDYIVLYAGINDAKDMALVDDFQIDYTHGRVNKGFSKYTLGKSIHYHICPKNRKFIDKAPEIATETFKRNILSIVGVAEKHGIIPIVVEFNYNPVNDYSAGLIDAIDRNIKSIKNIVPRYIETEKMTEEDFIDGCHLSTSGMKKMGKAISENITSESVGKCMG